MRRRVLLLLVAAAVISAAAAQACVQKVRTPGAKNTATAANLVATNLADGLDGGSTGEESEEACECVPYYLCDNNNIITNGKGVIDIRMGSESDSECSDQTEICCGKSSLIFVNTNGAGPNQGKKLAYQATPNLGCGQRNKDGVGFRITGADEGEAQFGEFPWMVALLALENGQELFSGGGSLIHPQVVLTAAHSVDRFKTDPSSLRVRVGEWDTQSSAEIIPHQQLAVKEVIVHEDYNRGTMFNDIALLVLEDPVVPAENVGTVCLPEQDAVVNSANCLATGWGKDIFGKDGCYQVILKSIELPIVEPKRCQKLLRKTRLGRRFKLDASFTCAGGVEDQDACKGDGGGPLACPIPGAEDFYQQAGIISWGIGCGDHDVPGVYADVAKFRYWIDDMFDERRFDTNTYQRPWVGGASGASD